MKRLLSLVILLLTLCAGARATQITVSSFQPLAEWRYGGTSATLRVSVSQGFLASTGEWIPASTSTNFYRTITCSISGTTITVPSFVLPSTTNGNPTSARYKFQFFGPGTANTPRDVLFSNFQVPTILGTTITIGQLVAFNQAAPVPPRPGFPDIQQVQALINAVVPAPKATTTVEGIGRISVTPADVAHPVFVGDNDPRNTDTRTPTDNTVTSAKIVDGAIINADVNASAAIAPTKIAGTAVITTDSRLQDAVNVATCATAGAGTIASPWIGWNNTGLCAWGNKSYYFGGQVTGAPGVYSTSTTINWSFGPSNNSPTAKPIYIEGNNAQINCTGSGTNCIEVKSTTDTNESFLHGVRIQNLKVRNTGTWNTGLYISGNFAGVYESLDIAWFTSKNFHLRGVIVDYFNLINSFPETGEPVTVDPIYIADDLLSSANHFLNLNAVGATHASIYVGDCQNSYFSGTGEGNADLDRGGLGLICNTQCHNNTFEMDNEANEIGGTGRDFSVDGYSNSFNGIVSTGLVRLTSQAHQNKFTGGLFNSIQIDSPARNNRFIGGKYNLSGTGTFTDNGINNVYFICTYADITSCKVNDSTGYFVNSSVLQSEHEILGTSALVTGTKTITIPTANGFPGGVYTCYLTNTTAARALQLTPLTATTFQVDGTGTDAFLYRCKGR